MAETKKKGFANEKVVNKCHVCAGQFKFKQFFQTADKKAHFLIECEDCGQLIRIEANDYGQRSSKAGH